jgi:signal transduction histidine kinase
MTVAATVLVAAAMVLASWLLVASVRSSLRADQRSESHVVVNHALSWLQTEAARGIPLGAPIPAPAGYGVLLLDQQGRIVGGSRGYQGANFTSLVGKSAASQIVGENGRPFPGSVPGERHTLFINGQIYDVLPLSVQVGDQSTGAFLVATAPTVSIESSIDTITTTLWWAIPILILLVGGIAWLVTGRALRPVETIRTEVTAISHSSLDRRVSVPKANDEVGRLARTMNKMLDRLEDAADRQRRFVSDASHELRSPVAAMRATGEVALAHPDATDWPIVVRRMLVEDDRMEQIVGDLLDLARGEESDLPHTAIDLDDVALDEAARARRSGVTVQTSAVSAGRVRGSREQLTRVVRNLLDNATRHARSRVRVSLTADEHRVVLAVDDDGGGIPVAERERVFERFTRLDEGRARDEGGLGLGLAMVRAIADRHGGTAAVTDPIDDTYPGARVVVTLPSAQP